MSESNSPELAVVGYGLTAREALEIVPDLFPESGVTVYGNRSVGRETPFGPIRAMPDAGAPEADYALLHTEADVSGELAPRFTEAGVTVVDLSTRYRTDPDRPLVVAPFNGDVLTGAEELLPNPNCTTAIMLTALGPLHREYGIDRLIVTSQQAVSGMGLEGERSLRSQAAAELAGTSGGSADLAFNVQAEIPGEAEKVGQETRKILGKPSVSVSARCTRVPVSVSHCVDVTVLTETPVTEAGLVRLLESAPGVDYRPDAYPTPKDAAGRDEVLVGPIWVDPANPRELRMWIVGDNLRRGAALNALEIVRRLETVRAE